MNSKLCFHFVTLQAFKYKLCETFIYLCKYLLAVVLKHSLASKIWCMIKQIANSVIDEAKMNHKFSYQNCFIRL